MTIEVITPLAVGVAPFFTAGWPGVAVTLRDRQGQGMTGNVEIRVKELLPVALRSSAPIIDLVQDPAKTRDVPGAEGRARCTVAAGGSRRLLIPLPDASLSPSRRYQVLATVAAADGRHFSVTAPANFLPGAVSPTRWRWRATSPIGRPDGA